MNRRTLLRALAALPLGFLLPGPKTGPYVLPLIDATKDDLTLGDVTTNWVMLAATTHYQPGQPLVQHRTEYWRNHDNQQMIQVDLIRELSEPDEWYLVEEE